MKSSWDLRIARASELLQKPSAATELLKFYEQLARLQKSIYEELSAYEDHNLEVLIPFFRELLALTNEKGSPQLRAAADQLANVGKEDWLELLQAVWQHQAEAQNLAPEYLFFANALLQPYAELLAEKATGVQEGTTPPLCPFCGSKPQVAVLRPEGDGGKRNLICSLCSTEWSYRRQLCPGCGEEHKDKLPVFVANEFDYVRVDACDTCKSYIKSIDLTKNGRAVPVVDELATISLNFWAQEKSYHKLAPNLFGV
ncbi:MAG TPA: formate dehydrogenase accessory protein FdhE [Candidatus Angelobacter sp.]|nr:formate dehydrogenase accessory protein FdhE [Candidatus Angelobacter sp.]